MKRINNEKILDTIYDLADSLGLRIDEFLERVEEEFGEQPINTEGLPENIVSELNGARDIKKEQRKMLRDKKNREEIERDIAQFREVFPNVNPEEIDESVWEDVKSGVSLLHAYSLFLIKSEADKKIAESVNRKNGDMAAFASSNGSTEPVFTKEQVEKMSNGDVKRNYKSILNAMKKWRY